MNNENPLNNDPNKYSPPSLTEKIIGIFVAIALTIFAVSQSKAQISVPFTEYSTTVTAPAQRLYWEKLTPEIAATLKDGNYAFGRFREGEYPDAISAQNVLPYKQGNCNGGYHGLYMAKNAMGETIYDVTHYMPLDYLSLSEQLNVLYNNRNLNGPLAKEICIE